MSLLLRNTLGPHVVKSRVVHLQFTTTPSHIVSFVDYVRIRSILLGHYSLVTSVTLRLLRQNVTFTPFRFQFLRTSH